MISTKKLTKRYIEHLIAAFSLVIGLSWNSAFQNYFDKNEKLNKRKYGRWLYAIIITMILILFITFLNNFTELL